MSNIAKSNPINITTPATAHAFSINLSTFDRTITHITGCNNKHLLCF
ncbi:hypothetical protein [uncultured Gammaproteobacteria bacterium]|nr:hypothetical protein [uncultured Gammaproteobacteria bacterium]CAC9959735.1 hypothetical protein [uncultured Gammaproteobacteria bacterium]CAC9969620.1 hypothetical protein [uncultured Gammaproteobacteria bacterium]CAC9971713.1 hypothetical protein [uncultured Gammaproteobacteria bacterium]